MVSQSPSSFPTHGALYLGPPQHESCTPHCLCMCLYYPQCRGRRLLTPISLLFNLSQQYYSLLNSFYWLPAMSWKPGSRGHRDLSTPLFPAQGAFLSYIHKYAQLSMLGAVEGVLLKWMCILLSSWVTYTHNKTVHQVISELTSCWG